MADVQAWANNIAQQLFDGPQDLANEAAANVTDASGLAFFVGKPNGSSGQWTLKKLTPTELGKLVYNYLTTQSIAQQLASVLGALNLYNEVMPQHIIQSTGDVLNINCGGLWQFSGKDANNVYPAHHPDPEHWYYAYVYGTAEVTIIIAIATRNEKAFIGVRRDNDITWKQIPYTT